MKIESKGYIILKTQGDSYLSSVWSYEWGTEFDWDEQPNNVHVFETLEEAKEHLENKIGLINKPYCEIRSYESCFLYQIGERDLK